jgi:hypothetical protein
LPIAIASSVLLGMSLLYGASPRRIIRLAALGAVAFVVATRFQAGGEVVHRRNFYGVLEVTDSGDGDSAVRSLYNGKTTHGAQFLAPARSRQPTAYYGLQSGVGHALQSLAAAPRAVAIVGLGVGTLAAYGRPGDRFRFYEINPAVAEIAVHEFRFLAESQAHTEVVIGDGRLLLDRDPPGTFDIIVLDAFSGDAIPVHLLTREAFAMDFERLRPSGILAVHITNRYLSLDSVVQALAADLRKQIRIVHSQSDAERRILAADWALLSDGAPPPVSPQLPRVWTDNYSDLFHVLK